MSCPLASAAKISIVSGLSLGSGQQAAGGFNCYRKADIVLSQCDSGTGFDTYVRT